MEFNSKVLDGKWEITGFPLETFDTSEIRSDNNHRLPTFYEGDFTIPVGIEPLDTFVDTSGWGKVRKTSNSKRLLKYAPCMSLSRWFDMYNKNGSKDGCNRLAVLVTQI